MAVNKMEYQEQFEAWHKQQNVSKKYKLRYDLNFDGSAYKDYRTNWAYLAFKAGYRAAKNGGE